MKIRKIALLILTIVMCFALALGVVACTDTDNPTGDSVNSTGSTDSNKDGSASTAGGNSSDAAGNNSGTQKPEPEEKIVVNGVTQNNNLTLFQTNKGEKTDKTAEFFDRTQDLVVGDDNAFVVKPEVQFLKVVTGSTPEPYTPATWNFNITVSRLTENNTYVELKDADLTTYVEKIDKVNATVDFSEEAVGNKFKISVCPEGTDAEDVAEFTKSVEVSVVDAYNVYTANELAYIENGSRQDEGRDGHWAEFKKTNGLTAEAKAGIVLQANISITKENIPAYFVYQANEIGENDGDRERAVGSLKDFESLYERHLSGSEQFIFNGNYFSIDCKTLPLVVRPSGNIVTEGQAYESHSSLTMFKHNDNGEENKTHVEMKNINFIGNAPRVEDTTKTGGIILGKSRIETLMYNNISNNFFITFFPEVSSKKYTIQKCKSYNAYSCFVYVWGSNDVHIEDSDFNSAGGPVIIADHVQANEGNGIPSSVTVKNSELHSYVTGQEAWFQMYNATAISSQIFTMNNAFTPFGRAFLKTRDTGSETLQFMDFVAFYKSGETNGLTSTKITGNFVQDEGDPMDFGTYTNPWNGFNNVTPNQKNQFIEGILAMSPEAPIFMTSGGGMSLLNPGVGLMQLDPTGTPTRIQDPSNAMFQGKQLYLYYSRMGIVLNYFNAGETI